MPVECNCQGRKKMAAPSFGLKICVALQFTSVHSKFLSWRLRGDNIKDWCGLGRDEWLRLRPQLWLSCYTCIGGRGQQATRIKALSTRVAKGPGVSWLDTEQRVASGSQHQSIQRKNWTTVRGHKTNKQTKYKQNENLLGSPSSYSEEHGRKIKVTRTELLALWWNHITQTSKSTPPFLHQSPAPPCACNSPRTPWKSSSEGLRSIQ